MFKRNVGLTDRVVRIVLGVMLIAMVFVGPKVIWGWLGVYPLLTGVLGICPVFNLFNIDTRPPKRMTVGF